MAKLQIWLLQRLYNLLRASPWRELAGMRERASAVRRAIRRLSKSPTSAKAPLRQQRDDILRQRNQRSKNRVRNARPHQAPTVRKKKPW